MLHKVVEHGEVRVPPVHDTRCLAQPHGFGGSVAGELITDPATRNDDTGLSVPAQEYAQPTRVEMELAGVPAAREGVPDDDDVKLAALEDIGGINDDLVDGQSSLQPGVLQARADVVSLVTVTDADGDVVGLQTPGAVLVHDRDVSDDEFFNNVDDRLDGLGIGLRHREVV